MIIEIEFLFIGLLYVALGFPLFLGKVKRNSLYGFRIEKTLADDKYWYPVNQVAGKWFIIGGVLISLVAGVLLSLSLSEMNHVIVLAAATLAATALPIIFGLKQLKQIN